jgi:hypothetical protein
MIDNGLLSAKRTPALLRIAVQVSTNTRRSIIRLSAFISAVDIRLRDRARETIDVGEVERKRRSSESTNQRDGMSFDLFKANSSLIYELSCPNAFIGHPF